MLGAPPILGSAREAAHPPRQGFRGKLPEIPPPEPETQAISKRVKRNRESVPFDVEELIEMDLPWSSGDPDWGM